MQQLGIYTNQPNFHPPQQINPMQQQMQYNQMQYNPMQPQMMYTNNQAGAMYYGNQMNNMGQMNNIMGGNPMSCKKCLENYFRGYDE